VAHGRGGSCGVRIVEGPTIGKHNGHHRTLAFFAANRLTLGGDTVAGLRPAVLQMWASYAAWERGKTGPRRERLAAGCDTCGSRSEGHSGTCGRNGIAAKVAFGYVL
jgi:hypothetical protein